VDTPEPIGAVVVAYRPDAARIDALLARLAPQVAQLVVFDNSETGADRAVVARAASAHGARLLGDGVNTGVGAAQNRGIAACLAAGARGVLLFDDDSLPDAGLVAALSRGLERARALGARVAAVGPWAFDEREPAAPLVFGATPRGPRRVRRPSTSAREAGDGAGPRDALESSGPDDGLVPVAFLLASGCLIDARALADVGPMREDLFIDHVDLEWGVRARAKGWTLYALADVPMAHRLGEQVRRIGWLGGRAVHLHSPLRNYYLVRNTLLLVREHSLPAGWRAGYLAWLARYVAYNLLAVAPRADRALAVARALAHALRGRAGPA